MFEGSGSPICGCWRWQDMLGVWRDMLGVWRDMLGVWRDMLGVWRDMLGVWRDMLGVWRDMLGVSWWLPRGDDQGAVSMQPALFWKERSHTGCHQCYLAFYSFIKSVWPRKWKVNVLENRFSHRWTFLKIVGHAECILVVALWWKSGERISLCHLASWAQVPLSSFFPGSLEQGEHSSPSLEQVEHSSPSLEQGEHSSPSLEQGEHSSPSLEQGEHSSPSLKQGEHSSPSLEQGEHSSPSLEQGGT